MLPARPDAAGLLGLWEAASAEAPAWRGLALLRGAGVAPAASLGGCNAQWASLHAQWFGPTIDLVSHCPACGSAAEFTVDASVLAAQLAPQEAPVVQRLECQGHHVTFRLPQPEDAAAAAALADDDEAFAHALLARCLGDCSRGDVAVLPAALPADVLDAVSRRIEALDPGAELAFALECPQCASAWSAPLDLAELLWRKLRDAAERLLLEVDALARAYGWSEPEVLALSPVRRAAYLQMAAG